MKPIRALSLTALVAPALLAGCAIEPWGQPYARKRLVDPVCSDNANAESLDISRNRQLGTFHDISFGGKLSCTCARAPGKYEVKLNGGYELIHFKFSDFTDLRTNAPHAFTAHLLQIYASATS